MRLESLLGPIERLERRVALAPRKLSGPTCAVAPTTSGRNVVDETIEEMRIGDPGLASHLHAQVPPLHHAATRAEVMPCIE